MILDILKGFWMLIERVEVGLALIGLGLVGLLVALIVVRSR